MFFSTGIKYKLDQPSLTSHVDYNWADAGICCELVFSEGGAYDLPFVPAQKESNIASDTDG